MPTLRTTFKRFKVTMSSPLAIACHETWTSYCEVAYMHGIKYICDKTVGFYIRLIWAGIVIIMFALATRLVYSIYLDFIDDPTRLFIDTDSASTAQLLYPAVTVCPRQVFNISKAKDFVMSLNLPENTTSEIMLENLVELNGLFSHKFKFNKSRLATLHAIFATNNVTTEAIFAATEWDCGELFYRCRFQAKFRNCSELFYVSKTFTGLCCSFNAPQITIEKMTTKPVKSNRFTLRQGLSFILKNHEFDSNQATFKPWFQILIHESSVYPGEITFQKFIPTNQEIMFRSKPMETVCAPEVWRRLDVNERKCALPSEKNLRFFSQYHRPNCLTECRIMNTQKLCGCIPYYLFRDKETPVCDFEQALCLSENYDRLIALRSSCDCPDSCEKVEYSIRLTSTDMREGVGEIDQFYDGIQPNYSVVHVYMPSQLYRRVRRDIIWNIVSLIGNLGNSFSIFIGLSALSVTQFLYFFTFVLRRNYRKTLLVGDQTLFKKSLIKRNTNIRR